MKLKSVVIVADKANLNGHIYPKKLLRQLVKDYKKMVKENRMVGTMGMPESSVVNLSDVSHMITSLEMKKNELVAEAEVLDTPMGKKLKRQMGLALNGIDTKYVLRLSGLGICDENGKIGDDYHLISINAVKESDAS